MDRMCVETDRSVIREFEKYFNIPVSQLKNYVANFGKRTPSNDFLDISRKFASSNLLWFKRTHSVGEWVSKVTDCHDVAKKQAIQEFHKLRRIDLLRDTLNREYSSICASAEYFHRDIDLTEKMRVNELILKSFTKPRIVLDSTCYIRMINR